MGIIWKIIRIIGLYVAFFIASTIISAILLDSLPDAVEALFILFAPVVFIIWYEKRRAAKIALRTAPVENITALRRSLVPEQADAQNSRTDPLPEWRDILPVTHPHLLEEPMPSRPDSAEASAPSRVPVTPISASSDGPKSSRTRELRERLFGDASSIFDPKNADRIQAIASRSPAVQKKPDGSIDPASSQAYRSQQDNAELVRVGRVAREALQAASLRRAAEKEGRAPQQGAPSTKLSVANQGTDPAVARPSRIEDLRQKLFGGEPRAPSPPIVAKPAEQRPASRPPSSSVKAQGWQRKGQIVTIAGREIDGMVYVGTPPNFNAHGYGEKCRTYIDPSLSVASYGSDKNGDGMFYWPGYSSIPAVCRATYLDWLAGGRCDGTVNPGYMFLFFYGLERRFLVDQPPEDEKLEIVAEVERLKALFAQNYSVQRYLGEFLDIARIVAMGGLSLDDPALKQSILDNRSWDLRSAIWSWQRRTCVPIAPAK